MHSSLLCPQSHVSLSFLSLLDLSAFGIAYLAFPTYVGNVLFVLPLLYFATLFHPVLHRHHALISLAHIPIFNLFYFSFAFSLRLSEAQCAARVRTRNIFDL